MRGRLWAVACATVVLVMGACSSGTPVADPPGPNAGATPSAAATAVPVPVVPSPSVPLVEIPIRLVRSIDDPATEDFATVTAEVLNDPRGWRRAGFVFRFTDDAPYSVVLAEGGEVDRLCHPYDTGGMYSCQIGPVVALNADRWRSATDTWPGSLAAYRAMLVNHEVGHLLGQHHRVPKCARPGRRAAVMAQQSARLDGCAPNSWPMRWEIACAARHEEPIAPGYEESPQPTCGPRDVRR